MQRRYRKPTLHEDIATRRLSIYRAYASACADIARRALMTSLVSPARLENNPEPNAAWPDINSQSRLPNISTHAHLSGRRRRGASAFICGR